MSDQNSTSSNDSRISRMDWPYYWLGQATDNKTKKWVIFFGNDFNDTTEINIPEFIARNNKCLNFIRKNYPDCNLIYRPHPAEKNESDFLDLTSFIIQKDGEIAETFLWKNREKIKCTFSVFSGASITSLNLGFNTYVFYHYFRDIFSGINKIFVDNYLNKLPPAVFIDDLNVPVQENGTFPKEDKELRADFKKILTEKPGPVWLTVIENRYLLTVISLARMIKHDFPDRKLNLIISKHYRWTEQNLKDLKENFDEIISFPRQFYSLKPGRIISAFLLSRQLKNFHIDKDSALIGLAHHDFIENCLVSYHRNNFKIAILPEAIWRLNFKTEELGFDPNKFRFNKAGLFYNRFLEPILGLNRTMFVHHGDNSNSYFIRLQKPIEQIYDKVYLIK